MLNSFHLRIAKDTLWKKKSHDQSAVQIFEKLDGTMAPDATTATGWQVC